MRIWFYALFIRTLVFGGVVGYVDRETGLWGFSHLLVVCQILLGLTELHPVVGKQTDNRYDPKDDEPNRLLEIAGTNLGTERSPTESDSTFAGFLLVVNLVLDSTQGLGHFRHRLEQPNQHVVV